MLRSGILRFSCILFLLSDVSAQAKDKSPAGASLRDAGRAEFKLEMLREPSEFLTNDTTFQRFATITLKGKESVLDFDMNLQIVPTRDTNGDQDWRVDNFNMRLALIDIPFADFFSLKIPVGLMWPMNLGKVDSFGYDILHFMVGVKGTFHLGVADIGVGNDMHVPQTWDKSTTEVDDQDYTYTPPNYYRFYTDISTGSFLGFRGFGGAGLYSFGTGKYETPIRDYEAKHSAFYYLNGGAGFSPNGFWEVRAGINKVVFSDVNQRTIYQLTGTRLLDFAHDSVFLSLSAYMK